MRLELIENPYAVAESEMEYFPKSSELFHSEPDTGYSVPIRL
jgi:hypothetical protein